MFAVNRFNQSGQVLVAACDPDLLGTEHDEGDIHLAVPPSFYDGGRLEEDELRNHLAVCTIANLVGEKTIAVAVAMGLIEESNVSTVDGVPHAQFMAI